MGGNASTIPVLKGTVVSRERENNAKLERFIAFASANGPCIQVLYSILATTRGTQAFCNYISATSSVHVFELLCSIRSILAIPLDSKELCLQFEMVVDEYLRAGSQRYFVITSKLQDVIREHDRADKVHTSYNNTICLVLRAVENEVLYHLASEYLQHFLWSHQYTSWRASEASHASAQTEIEHTRIFVTPIKALSRGMLVAAATEIEFAIPVVELIFTALDSVDPTELKYILNSESWLSALLGGVESLPFGFSLTAVRASRRGFPMVYVNRYFELMMGYDRKFMIGKSATFLQSAFTEPASLQVLIEAGRSGTYAETLITNASKDGRQIKMLIAVSPIFNEKNECVYMFGVHLDVGCEVDECVQKFNMVRRLLCLLPTHIVENVK